MEKDESAVSGRKLSSLFRKLIDENLKEPVLHELFYLFNTIYQAIDSSLSGNVITNLNGNIIYANPAFLHMFSLNNIEDVLGKPLTNFFSGYGLSDISDIEAIIDSSEGNSQELIVSGGDGKSLSIEINISNILDENGIIIGKFASLINRTRRREIEIQKDDLIKKLKEANENIKTLKGFIPICSRCKNIRDDKGYWHMVEEYIEKNSEALFSHGICPDCARILYPDLMKKIEEENPSDESK